MARAALFKRTVYIFSGVHKEFLTFAGVEGEGVKTPEYFLVTCMSVALE